MTRARLSPTSITITAKVRGASGGLPRLDFEPALRFSPDQDRIYLTFTVKGKQAKDAAAMRILYCPTSSTKDCVDESLTDPTLATVLDRPQQMVLPPHQALQRIPRGRARSEGATD